MKQFYIKCAAAAAVIIVSLIICARLSDMSSSSNSIAKTTADTLSAANVHISTDLIDTERREVCDCTMISSIDAVSLARQFLGRSIKKISDTEFSSSEGIFTVSNSHFTYSSAAPKFAADTRSVSASTATSIALRLCDEYGIDYADGATELSSVNDGYYVSVMKTLYGLPMFNNALVLDLHSDGLHSVFGVDFRIKEGTDTMREAKSASDALWEFARDCTDPKRDTIITGLKLGYMLDDPDRLETVLRPVWRIIVENSTIYYIDA